MIIMPIVQALGDILLMHTSLVALHLGICRHRVHGGEIVEGELDEASLGGAEQHASRSGVACLIAEDESDAIDIAAEILSYLPDHTLAEPDRIPGEDKWNRECKGLSKIVPSDSNLPYDMRSVIGEVVDEGRFLELFPGYAENIVIGFARLDGQSVGIVANQPKVLAGCLDIDASVKASEAHTHLDNKMYMSAKHLRLG